MDTSFHVGSPTELLQVPHLEQDLQDQWAQGGSSFPSTFVLIQESIPAPHLRALRGSVHDSDSFLTSLWVIDSSPCYHK